MDVIKKPVVNKKIMQALQQITAPFEAQRFAVACSGGVDSAMLALHVAVWAQQQGHTVHLFHVHHGLQQRAEGWLQQVHTLAQYLGVACHTQRVTVNLSAGDGMEAAARDARYEALASLAAFTGVQYIFLGHHQDDQAETVLLRLLRGAGPTGMGAMRAVMQRDGIQYLRPLLGIPRAQLIAVAEHFERDFDWQPVWDPTNIQDDYTRGALRDRLVPHLNQRWVGWQRVLARHAQQSQEAAEILDEVATADLATLDVQADNSFSLAMWRELSAARQSVVLRHWLAEQGLKMPTQARLQDMLRQLRQLHALGFDRHMQIRHDGVMVCAHRGRVYIA